MSSLGMRGRAGVNPALTAENSTTLFLGAMKSPISVLRSSYIRPSCPGIRQMTLSDAFAASTEGNTPL